MNGSGLVMGEWPLLLFALGGFLAVGTAYDVVKRRIPNWLNLTGLFLALAARVVVEGGGGAGDAALGMVAGLFLLLPLYSFASMGAGDVKMMAVVGAFVGAAKVASIALVSILVGGMISVCIILLRGELPEVCARYRTMLVHLLVAHELAYLPPRSGEWAGRRMAFAPSIAIATLMVAVWQPNWLPEWIYRGLY